MAKATHYVERFNSVTFYLSGNKSRMSGGGFLQRNGTGIDPLRIIGSGKAVNGWRGAGLRLPAEERKQFAILF